MDTLVISKIGTIFAMMALTVAFGVLPYFLVLRGSQSLLSGRLRQRAIRYFNCFGGGVFLGALLLHLMVEGAEKLEGTVLSGDFPFFNAFVAAGFFLVALVECFMHNVLMAHSSSDHDHHHHSREQEVVTVNEKESQKGLLTEPGHNSNSNGTAALPGYGSIGKDGNTRFTRESLYDSPPINHDDSLMTGHYNYNDHQDFPGGDTGNRSSTPVLDPCQETIQEAEDPNITEYVATTNSTSPLRAFLLFVALSFHTLFDGLAVGLQTKTFHLWEMFTAIAIHKCIVGFCLGYELFMKYRGKALKAVLWIFLFSLVSPIGICIGILLTSGAVEDTARKLCSGILQGLASGTFMYVTFFEILNEAWSDHHSRTFWDILFTLIGFVSMAIVKYLDKD